MIARRSLAFRWFLGIDRSRRRLLIGAAVLAAAGVWAAARLPLEWVPRVELPVVKIRAAWPGASSQDVERHVTAPIERAVAKSGAAGGIRSYSEQGLSTVVAEARSVGDLGRLTTAVTDRLRALEGSLPESVRPVLERQVPRRLRDQQGFMILQLSGETGPTVLRQVAEEILRPRLLSLSGVASVTTEGGRESELRISLLPDLLDQHRLSAQEISSSVMSRLDARSYGSLEGSGRTLLLGAEVADVEELRRLPVRREASKGGWLRLGEVSQIEFLPAPVRVFRRVDGRPMLTLALEREPGRSLLRVARTVRDELDALADRLPPAVTLEIVEDRSLRVREKLRDLLIRGGCGSILVLLIVAVMLRSSRATGVVFLSLVTALAFALVLLKAAGLSLNVLTLAGLVLVGGLLVDNAVIVLEQRFGRDSRASVGEPEKRAHGAALAFENVGLPLVGGTVTTVAVFLPLVYASGELRSLFVPLAVLVGLTLGFSLVASLAVLPALATPRAQALPALRRWQRWRILRIPYRFAARYPGSTLGLLLLTLGLPLPLLPDRLEEPVSGWSSPRLEELARRYNATIGADRVQDLRRYLDPILGGLLRPFVEHVPLGPGWGLEDRPEVYVHLDLPPGSGLAPADRLIRGFEEIALPSPAVRRTFTRVAGDRASLRVVFHESAMETEVPFVVREDLIRHATHLAGIEVSVSGLVPMGFQGGLGNVTGYIVEAHGPSYETLRQVARDFAERLETVPRVAGVDIEASRYGRMPTYEVLRFEWSAESTLRTGLSTRDLAARMRWRLAGGTSILQSRIGTEERLPIRMVMAGVESQDLAELLRSPSTFGDRPWRLGGQADVSRIRQAAAIEREDQHYKRYLQVFYRGPYELGREMLDRELAATQVPPGYRLERPTSAFLTAAVQKELLGILLGALGLIYLSMAAVFESWRLPWVVLLSVPVSFIGVAAAFLVSGVPFAEGAFIGLVLLIGIAVNDSILLVFRYRQLRRRRPATAPSLLARMAVDQRLRPMWTTTLTSVAGMLPLLILPEPGEFWLGLAIAVVGGLLGSTLLAPLASVALLSWGEQQQVRRADSRWVTTRPSTVVLTSGA